MGHRALALPLLVLGVVSAGPDSRALAQVAPVVPAPVAGERLNLRDVRFDLPGTGAAQGTSSPAFNPAISVIGNFIAVAGKNDLNEDPPLQLSEVEFAFQAAVDPYSRADFYLAAGPEGAEIEEGFITFTALPANLLLKVGKLRAEFGKMNTLHTHRLPAADRPLVTGNLLGGEEGLSDAGFSLSHLVPRGNLFLELTGEVFAAGSDVFESDEKSRLTYVGRARGFRDLSESTNLDVGFSYAHGPTPIDADPDDPDAGSLAVGKDLYGIDVTLRYRPLQTGLYRRLNVRAELVWSRQRLSEELRSTAFGFYALSEYQFARRWYVGGRVDRSGRPLDPSLVDSGGSAFVTFWPTEFSQIRGQYRHTRYAEGVRGHEVLFQFNFAIGAHGAHEF